MRFDWIEIENKSREKEEEKLVVCGSVKSVLGTSAAVSGIIIY